MENMVDGEVVVGGPVISTAAVTPRESFDMWSSIMSESVLPCSMEPLGEGPHYGSLTPQVMAEAISIAVASNSAELARRTPRHIARVPAPYVLAGLTLAGVSEVTTGEHRQRVPIGSMFLIDGERPQEARTSAYTALLIRVRKDALMRASGLREDSFPAFTLVEPVAHGALVTDFFRRLITLPGETIGAVPVLNAGIELLGAALALGGGVAASPASETLEREHLLRYLRDNLADPRLTVDRIADACGMSRRTLFRLLGDESGGPMALLRTLRIDRARQLLAAAPDRTVASIAHACGFTGDRNFYRVFRGETGMTPAEYREIVLSIGRSGTDGR
ncbi:helix-turn-helix transcriptional regulator [Nocardia sp. SSK8]|uniref:helix-turn-helix transcriptional regulator n=1 Tax=Nocardia sp. SSK8 TaxID=3120154 RepID=UPI00300A4BEC